MSARAPKGAGTIRKKTVTRRGKQYEYWEARYTSGFDPGTGKQVQRSITGKTQKEVSQKLKAATAAIDSGAYTPPSKRTLRQWLTEWEKTYFTDIKPRTVEIYTHNIDAFILPALGAVRLDTLGTPAIQQFYNTLTDERELSAATVKNVHSVLHKALQKAVELGYIRTNPADLCTLPKAQRPDIHPLDEKEISAFLRAIRGSRYELFFTVALFTGMRKSELIGLKWDSINFKAGTISICRQLEPLNSDKLRGYAFETPKSGKPRTITPAASVMALLKRWKSEQAQQRLRAGELWTDNGLVFTNEIGDHYIHATITNHFKEIVTGIGRPDVRFHDLRHSYAVAALRAGDDVKTVQESLGHASAAFTLDIYGHVTEQMKQESAARMDAFIKSVASV